MKKNIVNDKVIRAMAIGISAMLATATPMTALAAEEGEGTSPEPSTGEETKSESKVSEVKDAAEHASESAGTVQESAGTAQKSADIVKRDVVDSVEAGEAGTDSEGNDLAQAVIDAAENVENSTSEDGSSLDEVKNDITDAGTDITNADIQLGVAEENDKLLDEAYSEADKTAEDAAKIASDVKDTMNVANEKAGEQVKQIENAASVEEANAAYDKLTATAEQAQQDFDTKLNAYNEAKSAYEDAVQKIADCEKAYNDAITNATGNAATAQEKLEQAQAELVQAKENAATLEQAVAAAKDAVDKSAEDAMAIAELEDETRNDGGLNWKNEDKLFIAIMEKYYLPELGIQGAVVTRVQGKDNNEYNYFKAVYKDENGNEQIKYYNFKMDDNGKSKDDIVIFEKREVEIFGDADKTPDQYVKDNGSTVTVDYVEAGRENGSIVKVDGKYVEKNDVTVSETLVPNSEITTTSKEDVTVNEKTKQESWSYNEETGELVKTVTADVTTITYTDATFASDQSYATDAERDAAAAAKEKELEDATGKDATINETDETTYTYTANGTYIPTFTKTVEVNKEYESGYLWYEADSKKEAKEKAFDWAKDKIDDDLGDYYLIGDIKSDLSVSMTEEETETHKILGKKLTVVTDDSDYLVKGTVTATYAKVTKEAINQGTLAAIWDDIKSLFGSGSSTKAKLEQKVKAAIEADGGIFLSADWADGNWNRATVRYVKGEKVTTEEKKTEDAAKAAVKDAALVQAKAGGATGVHNVQTKGTVEIAHTTYSYTVDYLEKDSENTEENKIIARETYGNAVGLTGQIIQNKNYLDEKILLNQKDEGYRKFVDRDYEALTDKYNRLFEEAKLANAYVADAQTKVDALKAEIDALKTEIGNLENKSSNTKKLAELEAELAIAKADRDAAKDTLDVIIDKLKDAETTRDEVVDKLTPKKPGGGSGDNGGNRGNRDNNPGGGTSGETDDAPGADTTTEDSTTVPTVITTTATDNVVVTAPVAAVANGAGAGNVAAGNAGAGNAAGNVAAGNQGVVTIEDEAAPLAASIDDQDATDTKEAKEDVKTVTIEDEEAPLDASIDQEKMSWWWLLIVMVLGATGYEMYRKHQEKKKAAEEIKVEK